MAVADLRHEWEWIEDFLGVGTFVASAGLDPWLITDTSSAGTPTYTRLDHGESTGAFAPGVAQLSFDNQTEVQNVCLSFGDKLAIDFDKLRTFECRVRQAQATKDSNTTIAFGITGDRADAIDDIAIAAIFRLAAATASNVMVAESDDGTNNNDDVAIDGLELSTTWTYFKIDFSVKTDVKFYAEISGSLQRVASGTTFDMSGHTGGVQPFFQLQKASDNNTDKLEIDFIRLAGVR